MTDTAVQPAHPGGAGGFFLPRSRSTRSAAIILALLWLLLAGTGAALAGLPSRPDGWLPAGLLFLAGFLPLAGMLDVREWRRVTAVALVLSAGLGWASFHWAMPDHARLRREARHLKVPAGWHLVDAGQSGNLLCWDQCPSVGFEYVTAQSPEDAVSSINNVLKRAGWARDPAKDVIGNALLFDWRKGGLVVGGYASAKGPTVHVDGSPAQPIAPGNADVYLSFGTPNR